MGFVSWMVDFADSTDWYLNDGPISDHESWFCVGYTAARDAVPDVHRVAVLSGQALEELEAAYGVARAAAGPGAVTAVTSSAAV